MLERLEAVWKVATEWRTQCGGNFLDLKPEAVKAGIDAVGDNLSDRILLYVSLRASARGEAEIERGNEDWRSFFRRELSKLLHAMDNYQRYLDDESTKKSLGALVICQGTYSASVMPGPPRKIDGPDLFEGRTVRTDDARNLNPNSYDAVICDPPYGFNTDEEFWTFGAVVRDAMKAAIASLKEDGGQLLIACPQVSFSGKGLMPFVRGDFLARDVLRIAADLGRECFMPTFLTISPELNIRPPYYWVAEKTLKRSILHFWIRSKA
jgi:hypothetical protein